MTDKEFKDMVIRILDKGWLCLGTSIDTSKFAKRLDDEKFLQRFKKQAERRAEISCINEHDAVYNIFKTTNILTR